MLAGTIGGGGRLEFTVIGDAVNTASRVERLTRETGDTVLITDATLRLLQRDHGGFLERPAVELRGKREPVRVFAPRRPGGRRGSRGAGRRYAPAMSTETEQATHLHGGRLVAQRLKAHGVTKLFTLSGGHLFSIYDGCRAEGIDIVDVRHESAAAFAAEGWAKVTRRPAWRR